MTFQRPLDLAAPDMGDLQPLGAPSPEEQDTQAHPSAPNMFYKGLGKAPRPSKFALA